MPTIPELQAVMNGAGDDERLRVAAHRAITALQGLDAVGAFNAFVADKVARTAPAPEAEEE